MRREHGENLAGASAQRFQESPAQISLRGARAAYLGPSLDLAPHQNAVALIAIGVEQPFELAMLETRASPPTYERRRAALIAPGRRHHLQARGRMAFLYLDALSDDHAALREADLEPFADRIRDMAKAGASVDDICVAGGLPARAASDPRITALLREIDARPEAYPNVAVAAKSVGLSPSRCRTLVRTAVGVPFSRYRLWRRMARVCRELNDGGSLTDGAHAAGFASSAHLSASFRQMFGLPPSLLLKAGVRFSVD